MEKLPNILEEDIEKFLQLLRDRADRLTPSVLTSFITYPFVLYDFHKLMVYVDVRRSCVCTVLVL